MRSVNATLRKLTISDEERPVGIQIYGRDVESMVEAAKIVEQVKPDVIDINFGCPVKKVAGKGAGAGMLQNIPLLLDITREVVKAVNTPVTVKTRGRPGGATSIRLRLEPRPTAVTTSATPGSPITSLKWRPRGLSRSNARTRLGFATTTVPR